jgi:hypothetical protein
VPVACWITSCWWCLLMLLGLLGMQVLGLLLGLLGKVLLVWVAQP